MRIDYNFDESPQGGWRVREPCFFLFFFDNDKHNFVSFLPFVARLASSCARFFLSGGYGGLLQTRTGSPVRFPPNQLQCVWPGRCSAIGCIRRRPEECFLIRKIIRMAGRAGPQQLISRHPLHPTCLLFHPVVITPPKQKKTKKTEKKKH